MVEGHLHENVGKQPTLDISLCYLWPNFLPVDHNVHQDTLCMIPSQHQSHDSMVAS